MSGIAVPPECWDELSRFQIQVHFVYPLIPDRRFDYLAYNDGTYDEGDITGAGPTPEAAALDLIEQLEERNG